jgi:hypothetical protein
VKTLNSTFAALNPRMSATRLIEPRVALDPAWSLAGALVIISLVSLGNRRRPG